MTMNELRREIKKAIDRLPVKKLESLADYVRFLEYAPLERRIKEAEEEFAEGRGVNWRKVRRGAIS
jgi:hypothetical protein